MINISKNSNLLDKYYTPPELVEYVVNKIEEIIGKNGIEIIRKIFGVVLLAIAVKLFTSNIQELF